MRKVNFVLNSVKYSTIEKVHLTKLLNLDILQNYNITKFQACSCLSSFFFSLSLFSSSPSLLSPLHLPLHPFTCRTRITTAPSYLLPYHVRSDHSRRLLGVPAGVGTRGSHLDAIRPHGVYLLYGGIATASICLFDMFKAAK